MAWADIGLPLWGEIQHLQFVSVRGIECLPEAFLLVIRLYWGWSFMVAGWGKLMNVGSTATYFASLGIPLPGINAVLPVRDLAAQLIAEYAEAGRRVSAATGSL